MDEIVIGIDRVPDLKLKVGDIRGMSAEKLRETRKRIDSLAMACEEELDYEDGYRRSALPGPYSRLTKASDALELKKKIFASDGNYSRLVARLGEIATTELEIRETDIRQRQATFERFRSDTDVKTARDKVGSMWGKKKILIPELGEVSLAQMKDGYVHPNEDVRKATLEAALSLDDLEAVALPAIKTLNDKVRQDSQFPHFVEVQAHYSELPKAAVLEEMMRTFVVGTKKLYEALFRELISNEPVKTWNLDFLISKRDPFFRAEVPREPEKLFAIAKELFEKIGYKPELLNCLFDRTRPGVFIDLEPRQGKLGSATFSLGAESFGKNVMVHNPANYETDPRRRWYTLPHEFAHAVHYEMSRRAAVVYGAAFFVENTVTTETITSIHQALAMEKKAWLGHILDVDERELQKWNVFTDLRRMYGNINLSIGEIGMHCHGVEKARETFHEARELTKPEMLEGIRPSSSYAGVTHVWNTPGSLFPYVFGDFYAIAVLQKLRETFGSTISPDTAPFLIEHLMTGNIPPMHERVVKATGTTDIVENAVRYFNEKK